MKKIITIMITAVIVLGGLGAIAETEDKNEEFISECIVFSQPIISEKEDYVSIELSEATSISREEGKPSLPVFTKVFTFPFGTKIESVNVIFSQPITKVISKPVVPSPDIQIFSTNLVSNKIKGSDAVESYSDIDVYPDEQFGFRTGAGLNDGEEVTFLTVPIIPVQYRPKENAIYYSEEAEIDISYVLPEDPFVFPDEYDLLIIAPKNFESALQRLVDHKNNLDPPVRTIMVTLDEIPSGVGVDQQEDIKYFIKDAKENWGITYLLLVGAGVKDKELLPVRNAWVHSGTEEFFPSDLYFADIYNDTGGFSNWDYDGDGRYAEYSVDMKNVDAIPDLYLGKLPCNNIKEVNIVVDKIINYKAHNKMTKKILQAGGDSFTDDDIYEGEYANTVVMTKLSGYSTTQLWGSNGKLTKSNVAQGFKSSVDFVDFCGHGSYIVFATHPPKDDAWIPEKTLISQSSGFCNLDFDLYMVNNALKLPVCVYKSCSNNKYTENEKCFGWYTVSKSGGGGIATFAASGLSSGAHGIAIVESSTGWMEVHTFEELINTKILGQVWANDITDYYNFFDPSLDIIDWKTMLEWSMFGDPTLVIEDGDDPKSLSSDKPVISGFFQEIINYFPLLKIILEKFIL